MKKITILIADDHTLIRETWSFLLNTDERFAVIAECGSGEEAVETACRLRPDVVMLDINLPGMNGIEATQLLRKQLPQARILGVSLHTDPAYARKMMQKGAMGYVSKNSSSEELFRAITEVQQGRRYICEEIKSSLSDPVVNDGMPEGLPSLSQREIEIIRFIKKGFSSKEIAASLAITVKTVESHRYNMLKKLNLKNAAALVNYFNHSPFI